MPSLGLGLKNVGTDAADCHQTADAVWIVDGEVDADATAHRIADDVDFVHAECVQERHDGALCGDHRVAAEVGADAEAGEFQDQAAVVLGEGGQYPAEVTPAGDPGA